MKKTKNYAMPYPEQDDYFNVEDFQDMMVSVDDLMKKLSDSGAQISSDAEHLYNQTKAQMDNIQKRMNAFTALKDGSTTGDAELKDIRVAYDGKEYGNAGEAVREQASDIHKALFGNGVSIWSKTMSQSTKYVTAKRGIFILNEPFVADGVITKINRGTFRLNETKLGLDKVSTAYIVKFENTSGTMNVPSLENLKGVSACSIKFEEDGNAHCWIPVEKGQYLAVTSTVTAYETEDSKVPYMFWNQEQKTMEYCGFTPASSTQPAEPHSLALEYKLEYDMDDAGLVKQVAANRETAALLKEDINNITEEITIPGWYKIGYYSGEKHNTTNGVSLFFEIPKHVKQIRVVANGRAYFNDYTFINEDDNIVSYGTKLTQDKNINVLIDVPDGATKVVVGGKLEDCDSASVSYKATIKRETEAYIKRLVGKKSKTFFTVGVRSEGSVNNSIYYDVSNALSITVNGTFEARKDIATFIDNNGVLVGSVSATVTGSTEKTISVPKKAKTVYVSTTYQNLNSAVVFGKYEIDQSNLKGKKNVWLGTSIPAGGKNGIEVADSYPVYIGEMLDTTVYNEAVGSSCLHCKNKNRISERNPYGFVENFEGVSRCLTNTLNEMEWIIAHYNDTDVFTKNVPSTLLDKDKEFIRSCSYEKKINKYLTENNFPDLWIIDHGHNDTISDAQELQYEPMKMPWEAKTGFYQKGVLKTSVGKHLIEIDVDGFDMVYLSGVFNVGYDIYDIIDADGKVKKFEYANTTKTVENLEIDCQGASKVAFSTESDKLETVIIKAKSTENLYCYQGAFDFIVKKIKEFNQKAEIYMIGEYENQLRPAISNYQIKTSERWSFPLFKAWNMYGWSQKKIKCTGYWSDGIWVEDGIERETTFLNRWLPDTIHPHSDKSGEALWYMAKYISAWLKNLIN